MDTNKKATSAKDDGMPTTGTLRDLFVSMLQNTYYAEQQMIAALPDMMNGATDRKLKTALKDHQAQTEQQAVRLEQVFESLDVEAEGKKCPVIDALIAAGNSQMEKTEAGPVRDAGIIASAQKVEHYEIAAYGTLAAFAKTLNERSALELLLKTLGEEKKSDSLLSYIADTNLNSQAVDDRLQSKDLNAV